MIYTVISLGAILAIPFDDIIANKEYALASGASQVLGHWGTDLVVIGTLLATSSAISGTVFGASRQMAVIARDGFFPAILARQHNNIPAFAIISMALLAFVLILAGGLQLILEFGSVTFLLVSLLIAIANDRIRHKTGSSTWLTRLSIIGLTIGTVLILYYEAKHQPQQLLFIVSLFGILSLAAWFYATRIAGMRRNACD